MINFLWLLLAVCLLLLNAFFVAAEFGMVKLRYTRVKTLKTKYNLRGKILFKIHKNLDAYLSACQLGITLASLGLGWIGEPAFAYLLTPLFQSLGITSPNVVEIVAFFVAFSLISFLHIVIGELMPKSLAIRQSESVSLWTAVPLYGFHWLMYPAIWLLNTCSNFLLKTTGLDKTSKNEKYYSTEEIKLILSASKMHGELTSAETKIIKQTLEFADLNVTEVMRPREDMIVLDIQQPIAQLLHTIAEYRYSRYPIFDKDKQDVIGIIHVKDLYGSLYKQQSITDLTPLIRPILKVSHRLPALDLLSKFRKGMPHFALVYTNKDRLIGFVTLDNLLHILIGRIKDEFHKTKNDWIENPDGTFTIKGDCSIFSLEKALEQDIKLNDEEEFDTITGLILSRIGTLPQEGERISFREFDALIEKRQGMRIQTIKIYPKKLLRS